ncbi:MAG: sensor histidine kinase [Methyloprofundus sp.]|nr:sensor histidine kinase [Methyloprofundus sp.]MDT8425759.1 sensor histidine kinase [Methyloprofundus sp.]
MVLPDQAGDKTIDDVRLLNNDFSLAKQPFNRGHTRDVYWFRITLQRTENTGKDWLLSVTPATLNNLRLYTPNDKGSFTLHQSGNQIAAALHPIDRQFGAFTFPITLTNTSSTVFYLRLQTQSIYLLNLSISTAATLAQTNSEKKLLLGFVLGISVAASFLILLMWNKKHLWICVILISYMMSGLILLSAIDGIMADYVLPYHPKIAMLISPIGGCIMAFCFAAFSILFFDTRRYFPRLTFVFYGVMTLALLTILGIAFGQSMTLAPIAMLTTLLSLPVQLYISWIRAYRGPSGGHAIFYGSFLHLIFSMFLLLTILGLISINITQLLAAQMSLGALLLFTGLYHRFHKLELHQQKANIRSEIAEKLIAIEKQRNKDTSTFFNLVAHEIKTPLAVIDSTIQTLQAYPSMSNELVIERYYRIRQSIVHLKNLLDNTLSTEYGNQLLPAHTEQFLLAPFVIQTISSVLAENNCNIQIADDYRCTADRRLLNLALSNLLVNAEKYRPANTPISLQAIKDRHDGQNGTLFTISNSYISPLKPDTSAWFTKYYREKNQANINGLGLGLYLVQQVAQAHSGTLDCSVAPTPYADQWLISMNFWLPNHNVKENKK